MDGSTLTTEYRTIFLGPYGGDVRDYTFRASTNPMIKSGRTKVFPGNATLGPTDPDVGDTLTNFNVMDISGGIGTYTIKPASDLSNYWWGIAECEGTDGFTMAREALKASPPVGITGTHVPLGRIGASTYGLWDTTICIWNPATQVWTDTTRDLPNAIVNYEGIAYFNEQMFIPLGANGYSILSESAPGTLAAPTNVAGAATPAYVANATPTTNPKPFAFLVWRETIYALTTKADGHSFVGSMTGGTGTWQWALVADTARGRYAKMDTGFEPKTLAVFPNAQNQMSVWCAGRRGLKVFNDTTMSWEDTNLTDVPPHPDFGRSMKPFRPGEALWIAGGGGDLIQYTVGGAIVPASGPGGQKEGLPGGKRGSVISQATDLFHLYALVQGETAAGASASIVEDTEGGDAIYVPGAVATTSVIAYTGKGWHPKWESAVPGGTPTKIVVSDATISTGGTDYRVFWGLGEEAWSMQCRLSTHSSLQAIQTETGERFRSTFSPASYQESYIEWGRFNAGSIAINKLASHAALSMFSATATEYAEYQFYTDHMPDGAWETLGIATEDAEDGVPRTVLPFNTTADGQFSEGISFHWIRQRLRLVSSSPTLPPIVTALSLSYLPVPQDAATKAYTIPLPVDRDEKTGKTAEQIVATLEALLSPDPGDEKFLFLQDGQKIYRAYISSISYSRAPTPDANGSLQLTVLQIPSGLDTLLGEG